MRRATERRAGDEFPALLSLNLPSSRAKRGILPGNGTSHSSARSLTSLGMKTVKCHTVSTKLHPAPIMVVGQDPETICHKALAGSSPQHCSAPWAAATAEPDPAATP